MMRSLSSAVSGLKAHQTKMDVIGDNIANVNTYGFKSSRVTFTDVYYQTLSGAAGPRVGASGGTNPTQIGYGAKIGTIDVLNTIGAASATNQWGDVYISGDGYIAVQNAKGDIMYTRLGVLGFDAAGQLIDAGGNLVLGIPVDPVTNELQVNTDGTLDESQLVPIKVNIDLLNQMTGISISSDGKIIGILPGEVNFTIANAATLPTWIVDNGVHISEDADIVGSVEMMRTYADNGAGLGTDMDKIFSNFTAKSPIDAWGGTPKGNIAWTFDDSTGIITATWKDASGTDVTASATYKQSSVLEFKSKDGNTTYFTVESGTAAAEDAFHNAAGVSQIRNSTLVDCLAVKGNYVNGKSFTELLPTTAVAAAGETTLTFSTDGGDVSVTIDGTAFNATAAATADDFDSWGLGRVSNEDVITYTIGAIAIANFANAAGMTHVGNSYFTRSSNSGDPVYGMAGVVGGETDAGYLEMSNVDLSQEFTDMITTQRGFQANSRIITVSDEMLQELVNLKR